MSEYASNAGKTWTTEDKKKLIEMVNKHFTVPTIAKSLGRTEFSIDCKIENLKRMGKLPKSLEHTNMITVTIEEEEMKNTKVTTKTFIGNIDASTIETNDLLHIIEKETAFINQLKSMDHTSKKTTKIIEELTTNIIKLTELLEDKLINEE